MPRLTEYFGGPQILFKRDDLTGAVLSGNKVRKLEFSLAEAVRLKTDVVITAGGIQSNHCRATALASARLGMQCHLILRGTPDQPPQGNLLLDQLAGAHISFYSREEYSSRKAEIVAELTAEYESQGKRAYYIPVGASNAIGTCGYVLAYAEIMSQAQKSAQNIDHIVCATGSGGTVAGLIAGRALATGRGKPQIWGVNVCDDAPSFVESVGEILEEMNAKFSFGLKRKDLPINILDGYVGEGYAIPYPEALDLIQICGRLEGQILDPVYTSKALYGLSQEIRNGRFTNRETVVFVHTGGVFGLFAHPEQFGPSK